MLFSVALVFAPGYAFMTRKVKSERMKAYNFFEKHLEEHLEWFPVTRRAFNRAIEIKNKQIIDLETELAQKQARLQEKMKAGNVQI